MSGKTPSLVEVINGQLNTGVNAGNLGSGTKNPDGTSNVLGTVVGAGQNTLSVVELARLGMDGIPKWLPITGTILSGISGFGNATNILDAAALGGPIKLSDIAGLVSNGVSGLAGVLVLAGASGPVIVALGVVATGTGAYQLYTTATGAKIDVGSIVDTASLQPNVPLTPEQRAQVDSYLQELLPTLNAPGADLNSLFGLDLPTGATFTLGSGASGSTPVASSTDNYSNEGRNHPAPTGDSEQASVTPEPSYFNPASALGSTNSPYNYTVQPGDTVTSIAARLGMSVSEYSAFLYEHYGPNADLNSIVAGSDLPIPQAVYEQLHPINGYDLPDDSTGAASPQDIPQANDPFLDALLDAFENPVVPSDPGVQVADNGQGPWTDAGQQHGGADPWLPPEEDAQATAVGPEPGSPNTQRTQDAMTSAAVGLFQQAMSLEQWDQMDEGQRLAAVAALYNSFDALSGGALPGDLAGFTAGLSLIGALEDGDALRIAYNGIALGNFASASGMGVSDAIGGALNIPSSNVLPGLGLIIAIDSGDPVAMAAAAANFIPGVGPFIGFAITLLGGTFSDAPTIEGQAQAGWDDQGQLSTTITHSAEGGGPTAQNALNSLIDSLTQQLATSQADVAPADQWGLLPTQLPRIGYVNDPDGLQYRSGPSGQLTLTWTDERGQTHTRCYDSAGQRNDGSEWEMRRAANNPTWMLVA